MNKRIKEIVDQAGFVRFSPEEDPHTPIDWSCDYTEELNRFAELIVKECADHCDLLLDHKISSEWSRGTHDCSKAIKKLFGVE